MQPPVFPVNDTFTEFDALAPYCTEPPGGTGDGICEPSTVTLPTRSTVRNVMSAVVHDSDGDVHFVRTLA